MKPLDNSLVEIAVDAAAEKQASDVVVLDLSELLQIVDYFVICSGGSERQVKTIAEEIERRIKEETSLGPKRREGTTDGGWVLLDYIDFVVHVFSEEKRAYYDLERLWKDAPVVELANVATA